MLDLLLCQSLCIRSTGLYTFTDVKRTQIQNSVMHRPFKECLEITLKFPISMERGGYANLKEIFKMNTPVPQFPRSRSFFKVNGKYLIQTCPFNLGNYDTNFIHLIYFADKIYIICHHQPVTKTVM